MIASADRKDRLVPQRRIVHTAELTRKDGLLIEIQTARFLSDRPRVLVLVVTGLAVRIACVVRVVRVIRMVCVVAVVLMVMIVVARRRIVAAAAFVFAFDWRSLLWSGLTAGLISHGWVMNESWRVAVQK